MNRWIGLHIDLSEFPPTPERLLWLLRPLARLGLDTLLIEPGPMFPWTVDERFTCENAYPESLFGPLLASAEREAVTIVPMLDCFSRMSFVLRHAAYRHLRAVGKSADRLDPAAPGARGFMETLLDDLLEMFPGVRSVHLGGFCRAPADESRSAALSERELEEFLLPIVTSLFERGVRPIVSERILEGVPDGQVCELSRLCTIQLAHPEEHDRPPEHDRCGSAGISPGLFSSAPSLVTTVPLVRESTAAKALEVLPGKAPGSDMNAGSVRLSGVILTASGGHFGGQGAFPPREAAWTEIASAVLALRTGSTPSSDESGRVLAQAGWDETHREVRLRLDRFLSSLDEAWTLVRRVREQAAGATADPALRVPRDRDESSGAVRLHKAVEAADRAGTDLAAVLEGLCEMPQVRRFVTDRVLALREEALLVDAKLCQLGES